MRAFVFGAGASLHVGYPLARDLGRKLIDWAASNPRPDYLHWIDPNELPGILPSLDDFEGIITELENPTPRGAVSKIPRWKRGSILAGFRNVLCDLFDSKRVNDALLYRQFATEIIQPGDVVITFNYDVSLERELRRAGKWEISKGYGFDLRLASLPPSATELLKLHGSTNWIDLLFGGTVGISVVGTDALGMRPVILAQEFEFLEYPQIRDPLFNGGGVDRSGSMILPGRQKRFYVETSIGPRERGRFWTALWRKAGTALQQAHEIVIVGYSFLAADKRAYELVLNENNRDSNLTISCGHDNDRLVREFLRCGFARVRADSTNFEDWLATARARQSES